LKWSADGRWIAIWDAPSIGYKVHIYTADGHLYRVYSSDSGDGLHGLGVKSLEWSPRGDYLAIGGHDRRVTLLGTRTVCYPHKFVNSMLMITVLADDVPRPYPHHSIDRRLFSMGGASLRFLTTIVHNCISACYTAHSITCSIRSAVQDWHIDHIL
jgi:WD40 repeat protein